MAHPSLKKTIYISLLVIATCIVTVIGFNACNARHRITDLPQRNVVVLHSWDSIGEEGQYFQTVMKDAFVDKGINANIRHFYLNMLNNPSWLLAQYEWQHVSDELHKIKPDIILLNDDPIVEMVLSGNINDSLLVNTPIVFAGVTALQSDRRKNFPLMTGFEDRIDLVKNIELIYSVTGQKAVTVELDHERLDSVLMKRFNYILSDTAKYVNNEDFHLESSRSDWTSSQFPEKTAVHFLSAANPHLNRRSGQTDSIGKANLQRVYKYAVNMPQLQVKYDIYSNSIIDRTHLPQFTCIREQFNSSRRTRFLAGYFTSTKMQVEDQVEYAVRILNGEDPKSIPVTNHKADYFMDWKAMNMYAPPLRYGQFAKGKNGSQFNIINAPFELSNPVELSLICIAVVVLILLICKFVVRYLAKWRYEGQHELVEKLLYEEKIHELLFKSTNDTVWHLENNVFIVEDYYAKNLKLSSSAFPLEYVEEHLIHPDTMNAFMVLKNFRNLRGKKVLRLKITYDKGKTWKWVEIAFVATDESAEKNELYGLLFSIDEKKAMEEKLEQAQILSSEVELKENFLANISHDLRTPLGAVTGFSELLTMPDLELTDEERAEYSLYIHQNTEMILSMIDDVMHKAQTNDNMLEILQKPVEMSKLITECYQTNHILAPSHLNFSLVTAEPDCVVNVDLIRIKQVVNNFLSNAFKFTSEGAVTLGWRYVNNNELNNNVLTEVKDESEKGSDKPDWVEVYVQDTGIGIDPDNQRALFSRFTKMKETDRGTGLGLHISKTIVEKHQGVIGVESEVGKGSKFFFRLQRYVQCLLVALTTVVCGLSSTSCMKLYAPKIDANVIVVHSYDSLFYAYPQFNEEIRYNLVKEGINPRIRHIYLDLDNPRVTNLDSYVKTTEQYKASGFIADILLVEGDRAASFLLDVPLNTIDSKSKSMPIVLGGVHHPQWNLIRERNNFVAIHDPIEYVANLNLAVRMTGKNAVLIELDYFKQDSLIRKELREAIKRPPFVDNTDFHISKLDHNVIEQEFKDSVLVMTYSVDSPQLNKATDEESDEQGHIRLRKIFTHAWQYPSVSFKRDVYSSEIVDKTGRPQFTAVKSGFADGDARYLCGYFASFSTVAIDLAKMGAKILKGAKPSDLRGSKHEKHQYMDYEAMKILGLDYNDYKNDFIIVRAPLSITSPFLIYGLIAFVLCVLLGGCYATVLIAQSWRERDKATIIENVQRRSLIRNMALNDAECRNVRSEQTVMSIIDTVHPNHASEVQLMRQSVDVAGSHSYILYADIDRKGEYHWWHLRYAVMFDKKGKHVYGILFNIDKDKQREKRLKLAVELAEEAKQKEDFLTTISHELRTPLNAVVGFSDVMASLPIENISNEEKVKYGKIIRSNNNVLKGMIEDILMFSRIESRRMKFIDADFYVKGLIDELKEEWAPLMPESLILHTFCFEPEIVMHNDRTRLKYILNQMLSNAVKFTKRGAILLGVLYNHNKGEAEFVVGDTGCGISHDKQSTMFGLFWKDNEFIPGLGLGLHVAHKLAEGMNLHIDVESTVGYGTKMHVKGKAELRFNNVERTFIEPH